MLRNPFAELSADERRLVIEKFAEKGEEEYQRVLSDLRATLRQSHPLIVLSHMAYYGLSVAVDETTGVTKLDSDYEIFSFHVEILQALLLQIAPCELSGSPVRPDVFTQVRDLVTTLCETQNFRQMDAADVDLRDEELAVVLVQHLMRGATQFVRNWGYQSQIKRLARELYSPFDARLLKSRGYTASNILDVFETMYAEVESRQTAHRSSLVKLLKSSGESGRLLIENYHEMIGLEAEEAERFIESLNVEEMPLVPKQR